MHATWHEALTLKEWTGYMGSIGALAHLVERASTRLPYYITAASQQTKESLASIHGRTDRVELVPSGIDMSALQGIESATVDCDVLYVGRLVKDKHVDKLILAMEIAAQENPEIRCLIIGKGPEKAHLQHEVARNDLQDNVLFMEPLAHAVDIYAYMKAAKVFCSPSEREGFGIVTLEALGCGTPVITTDSTANAARHLVYDGQNGSIVESTPAALAEAIIYWTSFDQKLMNDTQLTGYDWHQIVQRQVEVYGL